MPTAYAIQKTQFEAKMARLKHSVPVVGRGLVVELGSDFVGAWLRFASRDTNRYARAVEQANNLAGLRPRAVSAVTQSRFSAKNRQRIEFQAKKWAGIVEAHEKDRTGRNDKWTRAAIKNRDRAAEELQRLDASPETAIVIGGKSNTKKQGLSSLARVITTLYGGTGRIYDDGGVWVLELRNKEPHAIIVERGNRKIRGQYALARAISAARITGLTRHHAAAVKKLAEASGLKG